jgi:hypothetical protein
MLKSKVDTLKLFLEEHKDLPEQGTEAWHAIRGIGGSELKMLIHDEATLVANKVGLRPIPEVLAMRWGNLLEDTLRNIMIFLLRTNIYETSSIPSKEVQGKTFSMDGIGIVRFLGTEWNERPQEFFIWLLTLFEFKCPLSRKIVKGEIYRDYIPQVLSGMSDLDIPEIALYIEGVFRISRFDMLGNNSHIETWLHKDGNPQNYRPMVYGFIGFYMEAPEIPDDPDAESLITFLQHGEVDFATLESPSLLSRLLKFTKTKDVKRWSSAMRFIGDEFSRCEFFQQHKIPTKNYEVDMDEQLVEFYKWCRLRGYMPLGILGYKLLDINIVPIEKQHGYTKQYEDKIHSALEKIKILKNIEDPGERETVWREMYDKPTPCEIDDEQTNALSLYVI